MACFMRAFLPPHTPMGDQLWGRSMAIITKAPVPDKPGPCSLRLDHEDWHPRRPAVQTRPDSRRGTLRATRDRAEV